MTATITYDDVHESGLLSRTERRVLALRLTFALVAAGLLLLSVVFRFLAPAQQAVAELIAGGAALLVAVPALTAAWHSLRYPDLHGITDQLVALAVVAAWACGDLTTAALLPLVMMIGHVLEERSLMGSQEAIRALAKLTRTTARRWREDAEPEEVASERLQPGDWIELRAGDRSPADGIVRRGQSSLDTSSITGESVPIEVQEGDRLLGGSINIDGQLLVELTDVGEQSTLGRVVALMQDAERAKPPVTRLLERYAGRYMLLVLLAAAGTWFVTNDSNAMLAVLVASCPCALVLAAPATSIAAIAVAGRHGILVKGSAFLEQLATVSSVILDKTGTVTRGVLQVTKVRAEQGVDAARMQRIAVSLGRASSHPVSRALATLTVDPISDLDDVRELRGLGVVASWEGRVIALGRRELFDELRVKVPPPPPHDGPVAGVAEGNRFLGWFLLADEPRPEARAALQELARLGLGRQILLTGDRAIVANRVAAEVGITQIRADVLPQGKMQCVIDEMRDGYRPLVVGDGINDSLALKAGTVGIAMGGHGADVVLASADLVLMSNDLRRLATCVRLSRRARRTIYVNVAVGLGWTLAIAIAAAAGWLGSSGALVAALLHNVGTFVVLANAGLLLKFQEPTR